MINIQIQVKEGKVYDSFNHKDSTLSENALAIRRLEEIKQTLLDIEYKNDLLLEKE